MKNLLFREILKPLSSRIGTIGAGAILGTIHADASALNELGSAIAIFVLVAFDLLFSRFTSKGA